MNRCKKPSNSTSSFCILISLTLFLSCEKVELQSVEDMYKYRVDTTFCTPLDLEEFQFGNILNQGEPLVVGSELYALLYPLSGSSISAYILYNLDLNTGETMWTWSDYLPSDNGYASKLVYDNSRVLLVSSRHAYIIDPETGSTLYSYVAPASANFADAFLHENTLYVTYFDSEGAWLIQMNPDGTNPQVVHQVPSPAGSASISHGIEVIKNDHITLLTLHVGNTSFPTPEDKILLSSNFESPSFHSYSMGESVSVTSSYPMLLTENNWFITANSMGQVSCITPPPFMQPIWSATFDARILKQNSRNAYYYGNKALLVMDKTTGELKFKDEYFGMLYAVDDDMLISSGGGNLRIMDPESMETMYRFGSRHTYRLFQVGQNEYVFVNNGNESGIGKISITPLQP